jgi:hypothetical protein
MPKEIDEDLIEATIRRVAESKAARAASPSSGTPWNEPATPDEDPIEATIRRVAESKAARDGAQPVEAPVSDAAALDEDPIEATIRRVAESKAARDGALPIEMPVSDAVAPVFGAGEAEPTAAEVEPESLPVVEPEPASEPKPAAATMMSDYGLGPVHNEPAPLPLPRRQPRASGALAPEWSPPAAHGDDVAEHLRAIAARLDAIVPLLEQIAQGGHSEPRGEWDRTSRVPSPVTQRQTVLRDSVENEGDVIDRRPLPAPLPPLVEPKRGLDLLPRTYRITVEDKRRGVDLVPLHRAMLGIEGARDMSLLNYTNGTAIVALETVDELDPESVRLAMQNAMKRDARIEVHNESTMVVKLTPED